MISSTSEAKALAYRLANRKQPVVGIDCETEGIDPRKQPAAGPAGRIVCWTLAWDDHDEEIIWANAETWAVLAPVLLTLPVVGHNCFSFDAHMFRKAGAPLGNIVADTIRMSRLINTNEDASHGLKMLMKYWLDIEPVGAFDELFTRRKCLEEVPEGKLRQTWRKMNPPELNCTCTVVPGYLVSPWTDEDGRDHEGYMEEAYTHHTKACLGMVPTLIGGAHSRIGSLREHIPLSTIPTEYPDLLPTLVKYALLDARASLSLYHKFKAQLETMAWEIPFLAHRFSTASGTAPAP